MSRLGVGVMIQMLGGNADSVAAVQASIGQKIVSMSLKNDQIEIGLKNGFTLVLADGGQSCCENRYVTTDDDLSVFTNTILKQVEVADAPEIKDEYGEHEVQFLRIHTGKGIAVFETHNEHNGYYGGFYVQARLKK